MTLRSDDQATVDRAAAAVPSVIDALLAEVPAGRRAELEAQVERADASWLERAGDDGAFAIAAWCRRELAALPRHGGYTWPRIVERVRGVVQRFEGRPLGPWLWIELVGATPGHKRTAVEYLCSLGGMFRVNYQVPVRAAIRAKVPARGLLFDRLRRDSALRIDEILDGLLDPPLRPACEAMLRDRVAEVEPQLREMLGDATPGTREAIVRLLRTLDAALDQAGEAPRTSLAELEARLRANPTDEVTAQVWADLLQEQGDPRGGLLALDLAIAQESDRERMLALSASRAELFARDRKHVIGKPGGWPFREKYLGRGYIGFGSTWRGMIRGKPATRSDRVTRFFAELTDREPTVEGQLIRGTFALVWPSTRCALPYQESGHYPIELASSLRLNVASGRLELHLVFPFESFDDPLFVEIYEAVAETLGKIVLTPTGFSLVTPTVDGKKMKSKAHRYAGPK